MKIELEVKQGSNFDISEFLNKLPQGVSVTSMDTEYSEKTYGQLMLETYYDWAMCASSKQFSTTMARLKSQIMSVNDAITKYFEFVDANAEDVAHINGMFMNTGSPFDPSVSAGWLAIISDVKRIYRFLMHLTPPQYDFLNTMLSMTNAKFMTIWDAINEAFKLYELMATVFPKSDIPDHLYTYWKEDYQYHLNMSKKYAQGSVDYVEEGA